MGEGTWRVDPEIVLPAETLAGTRTILESKEVEMRAREKEAFVAVRDTGTRVMMIGCELIRASTPATTITLYILLCQVCTAAQGWLMYFYAWFEVRNAFGVKMWCWTAGGGRGVECVASSWRLYRFLCGWRGVQVSVPGILFC